MTDYERVEVGVGSYFDFCEVFRELVERGTVAARCGDDWLKTEQLLPEQCQCCEEDNAKRMK